MGLYDNSRKLENLGVISGRDMTTEAALAQLQDSDAAYQALRSHEIGKDLLVVVSTLAGGIWSAVLWLPVIKRNAQ